MPSSSSDRFNQIGNEYFGRGLYTDAYTYYQQALECDRGTGDLRALVAVDRKYRLPKLEENARRLAALRARFANGSSPL